MCAISKPDFNAFSSCEFYTASRVIKKLNLQKWFELSVHFIGVVIGMSMVSLEDIVNTGQKLEESYKKVGPHFVPKILTNMAAGLVSLQFGMKVSDL